MTARNPNTYAITTRYGGETEFIMTTQTPKSLQNSFQQGAATRRRAERYAGDSKSIVTRLVANKVCEA
jgi:hypothetical protein